ncbi:hypothetical protein OHA21_21620 [Actinoplanes sp. NBC_00393]|uniref:hypothetical protein n=1 Tax=Actinoplanes sp. NBC_00393 TaxID=2975953 RepID=UPI002E1E3257
MQLTEVSMLGLRSSVTTFRHRSAALRFVVIPVVHIGRPDYYRRIAQLIAGSHVVIAEQYDGPSSTGLAYLTAMRLSRQRHSRGLVHQDIDYAALGVPVIWPDGETLPGRRARIPLAGWLDLILLVPVLTFTMAVGGRDYLLRRGLEISDDTDPRLRTKFFQRIMLDERDELLTAAITTLHTERADEPIEIAIVYGAAHMPAVVRTLTGGLGYRPQRGGEWLLAFDF